MERMPKVRRRQSFLLRFSGPLERALLPSQASARPVHSDSVCGVCVGSRLIASLRSSTSGRIFSPSCARPWNQTRACDIHHRAVEMRSLARCGSRDGG